MCPAGVRQAPGLAVILVGNRKDSETYVRSKKKACAEVGIADFGTDLPEDATEEDVLAVRLQLRCSMHLVMTSTCGTCALESGSKAAYERLIRGFGGNGQPAGRHRAQHPYAFLPRSPHRR